MSASVVIVDYAVGNFLNVARAVEHCDGAPRLSSDPAVIRAADRLILPGVGAFGTCAHELRRGGLAEAVRDFAARGRPLLGICVGMQLLFDIGEEHGENAGLGLIPGRVTGLPTATTEGAPLRVPLVGWLPLRPPADRPDAWTGGILAGTPAGTMAYFVHSYHGVPTDPGAVLAQVDYGGHAVTAAVRRDAITGTQFHPEKSGAAGLSIVRRFLAD